MASDIVREVAPMCQGVHVMAIGWERYIPEVLETAGSVRRHDATHGIRHGDRHRIGIGKYAFIDVRCFCTYDLVLGESVAGLVNPAGGSTSMRRRLVEATSRLLAHARPDRASSR